MNTDPTYVPVDPTTVHADHLRHVPKRDLRQRNYADRLDLSFRELVEAGFTLDPYPPLGPVDSQGDLRLLGPDGHVYWYVSQASTIDGRLIGWLI